MADKTHTIASVNSYEITQFRLKVVIQPTTVPKLTNSLAGVIRKIKDRTKSTTETNYLYGLTCDKSLALYVGEAKREVIQTIKEL